MDYGSINSIDINYFLRLAHKNKHLGTCNRRQIACLLVDKQGEILASGYNGAPLVLGNCLQDDKVCPGRDIPAGQGGAGKCYGVHAEIRALKDCKYVSDIYYLFSTKAPCTQCVLTLMTTPCKYIYFSQDSNEILNKELWERAGNFWVHYNLE